MQYWIIVNGEPTGPYELEEVLKMNLDPETPVWHEGMSDWRPASTIVELGGQNINEVKIPPIPPIPEIPVDEASIPVFTSAQSGETPPPNYLPWCIVSILFCCLPASIVALFYSLRVNNAWISGDIEGAKKYSEKVEWWLMITIVLGLISIPFVLFMF